MADLNVTADFSDLTDLKRVLTELGPVATAMVSKLVRENKRLTQSLKADAQVQRQAIEMTIGSLAQKEMTEWGNAQRRRIALMQESERMAQKEITTTLRQRDAQAQLAAAKANSYQSNIAGNLGLSSNGTNAAASAAAMSAEMDRLRSKYDGIYASSKRYEAALEELDMAHRMGVFTTKQHEVAVENLNREMLNNGVAAQAGRQRMSEWGVVTQQAGYQVGDFFVQIQSGTSAFVAFGQQATQLVGVLPLIADKLGMTMTAAIGLSTALGIGIPITTAALALWWKYSEAQDKAAASADSLSEAQGRLRDDTESLKNKLDALKFGVDDESQAVALRSILDVTKQIQAVNKEWTNTDSLGRRQALAEEALALQKVLAEQQAIVDAQEEAQKAYDKELSRLKNITLQYKTYYNSRLSDQNRLIAKLKEEEENARLAAIQAGKIAEAINSLSDTSITVLVNFQAAFSGFAGKAAEWAGGTWDTMQAIAGGSDPVFNSPRPRGAPAMLGEPDSSSGSSGGGGGGGNARLESLISELQTEQETLAIWYEESQTALQSASDAEISILGGKHEAMLRLTEEYVKRKSEIEEMSNQWSLESAVGGAAEIFGALGAFNKKALKAQAVFAAGAALISTYQGAAKELEKGTFGFATAAAVIAKGIGFVAAIKSAGDGGGGRRDAGGGGRGVSTVAPAEREASPQTVYIDSITPDSLYSGQTLINLFDSFYNENSKRGQVFVVAR